MAAYPITSLPRHANHPHTSVAIRARSHSAMVRELAELRVKRHLPRLDLPVRHRSRGLLGLAALPKKHPIQPCLHRLRSYCRHHQSRSCHAASLASQLVPRDRSISRLEVQSSPRAHRSCSLLSRLHLRDVRVRQRFQRFV